MWQNITLDSGLLLYCFCVLGAITMPFFTISVNNNSVVKTVVIGVAIAITFVVIVFVVYLFRSKIKGKKQYNNKNIKDTDLT